MCDKKLSIHSEGTLKEYALETTLQKAHDRVRCLEWALGKLYSHHHWTPQCDEDHEQIMNMVFRELNQ